MLTKFNLKTQCTIHPFGKDLVFKPHPHCVVREGGFYGNGQFISIGRYIHYDTFHKK